MPDRQTIADDQREDRSTTCDIDPTPAANEDFQREDRWHACSALQHVALLFGKLFVFIGTSLLLVALLASARPALLLALGCHREEQQDWLRYSLTYSM